MDIVRAHRIAEEYCKLLEPGCKRIQIAGSVRRKKLAVDDIELVAEPLIVPVLNLFGDQIGEHNLLHELLESLKANGRIGLDDQVRRDGLRYKRFVHSDHSDLRAISIDLFIVIPPAQWGVILALRTGPALYSQWLVTQRSRGGALHDDSYIRDGAVWYDGQPLPMPEEADLFSFLGIPALPPSDRHAPWRDRQKD